MGPMVPAVIIIGIRELPCVAGFFPNRKMHSLVSRVAPRSRFLFFRRVV
jgi:hypothetical protein